MLITLLRYLLLICLFFLSYWAGFYSYEKTLWFGWKQTLGGDKQAVIFWSSIAYIIILVPLYLLICYVVKIKVKRKYFRLFFYPLFCTLSFMLPTIFITTIFGGSSILSPESQLFYVFFASSGIIFGIGYGIISLVFDANR
ncbi:hypothetical protein [Paenibacillus sp. NPDC057967]|uniref:hypothetical protein n=1 Tax=Paenibacillus sp. NPDC057967 TaxID=3346293 RepID=UPI0036DA8F9D